MEEPGLSNGTGKKAHQSWETVACYKISLKGVVKEDFEGEVDKWIDEGFLMPWEKEVEVGVLILMAVLQPTKGKVRLVFDLRGTVMSSAIRAEKSLIYAERGCGGGWLERPKWWT